MRARAGLGALAVAAAALAAAGPAGAVLTQSQLFFRTKLLTETTTSQSIKDLLRSGGFVDKSIAYRDLTGDGKPDAVVRVQSGGAPGAVALYVFSTAGGGPLRTVFRTQRLMRASTSIRKNVLSYDEARYVSGDSLCCPSKLLTTTLRWDAKATRFRVDSRTETTPATVPAPAPTPSP